MKLARCFVAVLVATSMSAGARSPGLIEACDSLEIANWMLGRWIAENGERVYEESWIRVSDASFEGVGSVQKVDEVEGQTETLTESLRLVLMSGQVFYLAKVAGNPLPVAFKLTSCDTNALRFENQKHDFPQVIAYTLSGEEMRVSVTGADDEGFALQFRRF